MSVQNPYDDSVIKGAGWTDETLKAIKEFVDALETLVGTIDAATTDSLHGKLGTDTELADHSLYDLLGGAAFKTNALSAMLGAFTAAQNLKAILGDLSTTKNLGGILGAFTTANNLKALLGALTTTDTLKAILGGYTAAAPLKAAIDALALEATLGTHDTALTAAKAVIDAIKLILDTPANFMADVSALALEASLGTHDTDIKALLATIAGYLDTEIAAILADTDPKVMGRSQIAATTIDLKRGDGGAGTDDLFTGTTQDVVLEKLVIRLPNVDCSDDVGGFTGISIQTDDVTPSVIISATDGAKANLTAEAQLAWTGAILIKVGTKIQITIIGDEADATTTCDVIAECRAVVSGGYLA